MSVCLFRQLNGIRGVEAHLKISRTTEVATMKFTHDVGIHKEAKKQKKMTHLALSVNQRPKSPQKRFLEMQLLDMLNFTKLKSEMNSENL